MNVRPAEPRDQVKWLQMRQALWPDCPLDKHRREMDEILQNSQSLAAFICEYAGAGPVGFLEASLRAHAEGCDTSPVGYIEGWYVDRKYRRQGLGGALARAAETWARQQGCLEMASDCLVANRASLAAHRALGFEEAERLIHFRKDLSP